MADHSKSTGRTVPPPQRRKLSRWVFWSVLIYAILGFFILPPVIRVVAVKQLSKQLDREVTIQKVKLNPFALSVTIRGLLIKDKDGEPFVSWDEVYVNLQLSSFLGHPWVFKEIRVVKPFARAQLNRDGTFNFSDLLAKFAPTNAPAAPSKAPARPIGLYIGRLLITNATASVTDLTHREPFHRLVGPLNISLVKFYTDPDNKNPYAFHGTTDAGESIAWNGFFYLDPLRSWGELTLDNFPLAKYSPLYQDQLPYEIHDGIVGLHVYYQLILSPTNRVMAVTNTSFTLRDFKVSEPGSGTNLADLDSLVVTGVNADAVARRAEIGQVAIDGGRFFLLRKPAATTNMAEVAAAPAPATNAPGGIPALLGLATNAVAMILNSTNLATGTVDDVELTNCAFQLEDLANSRPARLDLSNLALSVKNISNLPDTNLTVDLSLRWNTNGAIHTTVTASTAPLAADVQLDLDRLDLGTLDPYLEPMFNVFIPGSELNLHGRVQLTTPPGQLPQINFQGDTALDDFRIVDGVLGEDLLKWDSVRVSGVDADVNPLKVAIKQIAVDNAYARVIIETNHTINLLTALRPANAVADTNAPAATNAVVAKTATPPATNAAAAPLPPISIGSIVISNAVLRYTDRSVTPNVNLAVQQAGGTIAGLSSKELQHADVNLSASVDGVGPVDITGHINPFSQQQTNELKILVKNVDLTAASPYAGKFAGYRIAEGKLNLDLAYNVVGRSLKSKNVITLDQFTFGEKVNSPDATHLPVRLAVALLKDRNGQILLDVPIEGSLDDPQFRIGKVVVRTIVNILTKVATSPFSLLGAVLGGGGAELSYQDFAPGTAVLTPADQQKLDKLATALYDRPGLQLEITGSIDPDADRAGLQHLALEKELRTLKWRSLGKSERAATTPDQIVLTPDEHKELLKKRYRDALASGQITPAIIAANTNLTALAAQIPSLAGNIPKGATLLMKGLPAARPATAGATTAAARTATPVDPMEALLMATTPVSESDLEALAAERAKGVRAYLLASGKVEAKRLFLAESEAGVKTNGPRVYLQFQ